MHDSPHHLDPAVFIRETIYTFNFSEEEHRNWFIFAEAIYQPFLWGNGEQGISHNHGVTCVLHNKHTGLPKSVWGRHPCWGQRGLPVGGILQHSPLRRPRLTCPLPLEVNRLQQMTPFGDILVQIWQT